MRRLALALLVISSMAHAQELGLDLSAESRVKEVVLIPPVYKVTSTEGSFSGFSAAKTVEKLDTVAHKRLVAALEKALGSGKVLSTEATLQALAKEKLSIAALRTPSGMAQLAKATSAAWVIYYGFEKGVLSASIYTLLGETTGKAAQLQGVQVGGLQPAQADELQKKLAAHLVELTKAKPEETTAQLPPPPPPAEEEVSGEVESEIARDREKNKGIVESVDLSRPRAVLAVGGGASYRNQLVGGDNRGSLAELRNDSAPGIAVFVQVNPLHFIERFRDAPYSDVFIDANWRRSFVRARGSGSLDGQSCSVTDDEFQVRGNFRWRLGGMLPSVGIGAGWAQERAAFVGCDLPVVSAIYRGVDLQVRVKQPIFRDVVSLDVAFGPRVLMTGPLAPKAGVGLAGEAWLEAKPWSLLFVRGGARFFRAVMSDDVGIVTADVRAFFALEAGVHL